MKQFNHLLEQYLKDNVNLVKVRLKVDPKNRTGVDFRNFDGYEGYILKEDNYYKVLIEGIDLPVMRVPFSIIKIAEIEDSNMFDQVKLYAAQVLHKKNKITPEILNKLSACSSVDFFEQYLKEEGLTPEDLQDIYKKTLFNNTVCEKVNWGKIAKGLAKGVAIAGATAVAPSLMADFMIGRAGEATRDTREKVKNFLDPFDSGRGSPYINQKKADKIRNLLENDYGWTVSELDDRVMFIKYDDPNNPDQNKFDKIEIVYDPYVKKYELNYYRPKTPPQARTVIAKKIKAFDKATWGKIANQTPLM